MPITFTYHGEKEYQKFREATTQANTILSEESIYNLISDKPTPFEESTPSSLSPKTVSQLLENSTLHLEVHTYTNRNASIGGKFEPSEPNRVYLNRNAHSQRSSCAFAAVLIHQAIYALSAVNEDKVFSHCDQQQHNHQQTAPYWIQQQVRDAYCNAFLEEEKNIMAVELGKIIMYKTYKLFYPQGSQSSQEY